MGPWAVVNFRMPQFEYLKKNQFNKNLFNVRVPEYFLIPKKVLLRENF